MRCVGGRGRRGWGVCLKADGVIWRGAGGKRGGRAHTRPLWREARHNGAFPRHAARPGRGFEPRARDRGRGWRRSRVPGRASASVPACQRASVPGRRAQSPGRRASFRNGACVPPPRQPLPPFVPWRWCTRALNALSELPAIRATFGALLTAACVPTGSRRCLLCGTPSGPVAPRAPCSALWLARALVSTAFAARCATRLETRRGSGCLRSLGLPGVWCGAVVALG